MTQAGVFPSVCTVQGPRATALARAEDKVQTGSHRAEPEPNPSGSHGMRPGRVGDAAGAELPSWSRAQWLCSAWGCNAYRQRPGVARDSRRTGAGPGEVRLQVTWQPGLPCPAFFSTPAGIPSRFLLLGSKSKVLPCLVSVFP